MFAWSLAGLWKHCFVKIDGLLIYASLYLIMFNFHECSNQFFVNKCIRRGKKLAEVNQVNNSSQVRIIQMMVTNA